jgi:dTDP-4-amino-4,6-dideoxygalactose transaminase
MSESAYQSLISLPMFHGMSDQDTADVIEAVSKTISFYAA